MNQKFFIFFSEILGREVRDEKNRRAGILCDISLKMNGEIYPKAAALIIKKGLWPGREFARIAWEDVKEIADVVRIKTDLSSLSFERRRIRGDFSLSVDILDQQIVDINNRKVVRVNDVHLLKVDNNLYLAHVDVGTRGLARRLDWTGAVDHLVRSFSPHSAYLTQEEFISWKNTQVLTLGRAKNVLRLDVARQKLSQIPSTELADIMEDLDIFEKKVLFKSLEVDLQRKVFSDLTTAKQAELIEELSEKEAVNLLENIPSDEAADLLMKLPNRRTRRLMKMMQTKTSKQLRKLLEFSRDSAGGLMTTEYLSLPQDALVKDALKKIKENTDFPGNIYNIYVVDQHNHLLGFAPLRNFIDVEENLPLILFLDPHKIFVRTQDGIEQVALLLEKYKFSVIPVLNEEDVLQGVITIDDVMEELITTTWRKYREKI